MHKKGAKIKQIARQLNMSKNTGKGNSKGNGNIKDKVKKPKPWETQILEEDIQAGYMTYEEEPDYLIEPTSKAQYEYNNAGNRISLSTDQGKSEYEYNEADQMTWDGSYSYTYDANGNMTAVQSAGEEVTYSYTPSGKLEQVKYADGTYVKYSYDAFCRKATREEGYWAINSEDNGKSEYAHGQQKKSETPGNGKGNSSSASSKAQNPLKLRTETTNYLYDGFTNTVAKEYTGNGSPLGQYYTVNDRVISKKTFGNHGLVIPGREPSLKTNGGLVNYHYDGMRNVSELTDQLGQVVEQYRYDAFGGLYTGITAPYNTVSFAGQTYDPKANLVDMHARWYAAQNGRFTTQDTYRGDLLTPYTQNRYAYVGNNPVNRWDPTGNYEQGERYFVCKDYDWVLIDQWTEQGQREITSTTKVSDGWKTRWTETSTENKKYRIDVYDYWAYWGTLDYDYIYQYSYERTLTETTINSGTDFRPFTPEEWYEEHQDDLAPYNPPPAYSVINEQYSFGTSTIMNGTEAIVTLTSINGVRIDDIKTNILVEEAARMGGNDKQIFLVCSQPINIDASYIPLAQPDKGMDETIFEKLYDIFNKAAAARFTEYSINLQMTLSKLLDDISTKGYIDYADYKIPTIDIFELNDEIQNKIDEFINGNAGDKAAILGESSADFVWSLATYLIMDGTMKSTGMSEDADIFANKGASNAVEGVGKYSDEFTNWLNTGSANNKVYQGVINGEPVYTGITKQELSTRLYQHNYGGKGLDYLQETFSGLTRNQARAIEQYFIENGPGNALNRINSISPDSVYYDDAMQWATDFINGLK